MKAISRELGVRDDGFAVLTIASLKPLSYFEAGVSKLPNNACADASVQPQNARTRCLSVVARCCKEGDGTLLLSRRMVTGPTGERSIP